MESTIESIDELIWTRSFGLSPSGNLSLSLTRMPRRRWMWHITLDIFGTWDIQHVKLSALGNSHTKKEAVEKARVWLATFQRRP